MHSPDLKVIYYNSYMPEIFNSAKQAKKEEPVPSNHSDSSKAKSSRSVDEYSAILKQEKPKNNCLGPFLPKPFMIGFDNQMAGEQIVLVLRQHPVVLIQKIIGVIIATFLPIMFGSVGMESFFPQSYLFAMTLGWYTLILGYSLETFLVWFFSVFIITDERIIDVDFVSLLFKDISSAKIDAIEDISSKTGGMLGTIVDYGTVYIQTAGESPEIQFENVPQPAKVSAILNELILEEEREKIEGRVN
jgi:hypothetical protein